MVGSAHIPAGRALHADKDRDLRRIAPICATRWHVRASEPASLAVVAVDNAREIAPAVVILAELCANEGYAAPRDRPCRGAPVAKLLGAEGAGVQKVRNAGAPMSSVITTAGVTWCRPARSSSADPSGAGPLAAAPSQAVVSAAEQTDLLLTIAELDPAVGGEYLSTWARPPSPCSRRAEPVRRRGIRGRRDATAVRYAAPSLASSSVPTRLTRASAQPRTGRRGASRYGVTEGASEATAPTAARPGGSYNCERADRRGPSCAEVRPEADR